MELDSARSRSWEPAPQQHFTGHVWFGPMAPRPRVDSLNVLGVHFESGARTDWHTHPDGQVLYVTDGAGLVQNEAGEAVRVGPGDAVYAGPGELHWHGAGPDGHMTHLSLTSHGDTQWVGRKVSDAEYGSAIDTAGDSPTRGADRGVGHGYED